ncbi:MAG: DUF3619 family protein [Gammaproteobacteria bacterium]|nr:DUF3619 family protein [Gammaproteobacteria bacterium]MDH4316089.1 DUF3619 family protein [Gammaproteobacteria bacterium]MDH5215462.1 DUF3619 family protein [Gammaproteobacteria bacterium]MDH5499742.1 DUF3619 family protein [Gammaproteobacteria bacterium]
MSERDNDEQFAKRAKRLFDESVQDIDAQALSRLNRGRQKALAELQSGPKLGLLTGWVPATGVAAAAVVAVVLWSGNRMPIDLAPPATATDFEILLDQDSFEMLEELEFYSWIELDAETGTNVG